MKPLIPFLYLATIAAAGLSVTGFFSSVREGELRRRCSPTCLVKPDYAGIDRIAPDFTLKNQKGENVTLSSYRGKVVVLNFWMSSCKPCVEEMPALIELGQIVKNRSDIVVLTVTDDEEKKEGEAVLKGLAPNGAPFEVLMDHDLSVIAKKYGTEKYPETWVIDGDGIIRARFDGTRDWSQSAILEYLTQIANGGYCPYAIDKGKPTGEASRMCRDLGG
ncbi:MAG: TlpA family protein disulfide reductase [Polyangiaceae bacterium]|nr:TlpA family protein disulfide reductase [Polyangiaceae bacterium]